MAGWGCALDAEVERRSWIAVKGTVLPGIMLEISLYMMFALFVCILQQMRVDVPVSPLAHSIVGIALGMLLVFRTNVSYDRYWEARQRWSNLASAARNLCRGACQTQTGELVRLLSSYLTALRYRLQGHRRSPEQANRSVRSSSHPPLALTREITHWLQVAEANEQLPPHLARSLEGYVADLVAQQTALERLQSTPVPFAYMTHVRQLLTLYLLTLPLAMAGELGLWSVPAVAFVAFGLLGIERAGREIEDPFGDDDNDLPLERLTEEIVRDLGVLRG
jgi:putative membrane protein